MSQFFRRSLRQRLAINKREIVRRAKPWAIAFCGHMDFKFGKSPCSCPYVLQTEEWKAWMYGWLQAFDTEYGNVRRLP